MVRFSNRFFLLRKIVVLFIIMVCFLLQTTVFKSLALAGISANLLIVVTAAFGFMRGKKEGIYVGFFCGLLIDLFYGEALGFYALLYSLLGYGNGFFRKLYFPEDMKLPMLLISCSDLLLNCGIYIVLFLMRGRFQFVYYLWNLMVPEAVYTLVVSIILYVILLKTNQKLEAMEKRSAVKFGGDNKELGS